LFEFVRIEKLWITGWSARLLWLPAIKENLRGQVRRHRPRADWPYVTFFNCSQHETHGSVCRR